MDMADLVQAATRHLGERELALYLGIGVAELRRYRDSSAEVPRLTALRVVDLLLAESADPSLTLEAMADVLRGLTRV
jgi:hypothetical protein